MKRAKKDSKIQTKNMEVKQNGKSCVGWQLNLSSKRTLITRTFQSLLMVTTVIAQIQDFPVALNLGLNDEFTFKLNTAFPGKQIKSVKVSPDILNITKSMKTYNDQICRGVLLANIPPEYSINFSTCSSTQVFSQIEDKFQIWSICNRNKIVVIKLHPYQINYKEALTLLMVKTIDANVLKDDNIPGFKALAQDCVSLTYSDSMNAVVATCYLTYKRTDSRYWPSQQYAALFQWDAEQGNYRTFYLRSPFKLSFYRQYLFSQPDRVAVHLDGSSSSSPQYVNLAVVGAYMLRVGGTQQAYSFMCVGRCRMPDQTGEEYASCPLSYFRCQSPTGVSGFAGFEFKIGEGEVEIDPFVHNQLEDNFFLTEISKTNQSLFGMDLDEESREDRVHWKSKDKHFKRESQKNIFVGVDGYRQESLEEKELFAQNQSLLAVNAEFHYYKNLSRRRAQIVCNVGKGYPGCYPLLISLKFNHYQEYFMIACLVSSSVFNNSSEPLNSCLVELETPLHLWYPLNIYQMLKSDVQIYKDQNKNLKAFLVFSNQYVVISLDFDNQETRMVYNIDTFFRNYYVWFPVIYDRSDNFMVKYMNYGTRPHSLFNVVTFRKFDFFQRFLPHKAIDAFTLYDGYVYYFGRVTSSLDYACISKAFTDTYQLRFKLTQESLKRLPAMVNVSVIDSEDSVTNFSTFISHNETSQSEVLNSAFKTIDNSTLVVDLNLKGYLGKFARVSVPSLGIVDDKISLKELKFENQDKEGGGNGGVGEKRASIHPLNGAGYFAVVYSPFTELGPSFSSYNITILNCQLFSTDFSKNKSQPDCKITSRITNFSSTERVLIKGFYMFGVDYYFIYTKTLKNGTNRFTHYHLDSSTALPIQNPPFTHPSDIQAFENAKDIKILNNPYKFELFLLPLQTEHKNDNFTLQSFMFQRISPNDTHYHRLMPGFHYKYVGWTIFEAQAYKSETNFEILLAQKSFAKPFRYSYISDMEANVSIMAWKMDFKRFPPLNRNDFDWSGGFGHLFPSTVLIHSLPGPSIWCPLKKNIYAYSRYLDEFQKAKIDSFSGAFMSTDQLDYNSSMVVEQTECLSDVLMVQVLAKDLRSGKKYVINYRQNDTELRARYYSKIEVPATTKHIRAYLSPENDYINTGLTLEGSSGDGGLLVVVTRIKDARLVIDTSKISSGMSSKIEVIQRDTFRKEQKSYLNISVKDKPLFTVDNLSVPIHNPTQTQLIHQNRTIDLDSLIGINGTIGEIILNSTNYKNGDQYEFKGRKSKIGEYSVQSILGPLLDLNASLESGDPKKFSNNQKTISLAFEEDESKDRAAVNHLEGEFGEEKSSKKFIILGEEIEESGKTSKNPQDRNDKEAEVREIVYNLRMERLETVGNWLVGKFNYAPVGTYLRLFYKPENVTERHTGHDMVITGYDTPDTLRYQTLYFIKDFFISEDHFSTTGEPGEVYLGVAMVNIKAPQNKTIQVYRSGLRDGAPCLDLLALVDITVTDNSSVFSSNDYFLRPRGKSSFILGYRDNRVMNFSIYQKEEVQRNHLDFLKNQKRSKIFEGENPLPIISRAEYKMIKSITHHLEPDELTPDYFFGTLESSSYQTPNATGTEIGLLVGYISYKWPVLTLLYWPQYNISDQEKSEISKIQNFTIQLYDSFNLFPEKLVPVVMMKCTKNKLYNISVSSQLNSSEIRLQCYIGAMGAFSYETEYILRVNNGSKPLARTRQIGRVVVPDKFQDFYLEWLPDMMVVKMKNINQYVPINNTLLAQCPYMVVVYRISISEYPWAVYSCQDMNIIDPTQTPYFSLYRYQNKSYVWLNQNLNRDSIDNGTDPNTNKNISIEQVLKNLSLITVRSVKNSSVVLKTAFNFERMNLTIRRLNENLLLKRLGLLTSKCITPFKITFDSPKCYWFSAMLIVFFLAVYFGVLNHCLKLPWNNVSLYFFGFKSTPRVEDEERITEIDAEWLAELTESDGALETPRDHLEEMTRLEKSFISLFDIVEDSNLTDVTGRGRERDEGFNNHNFSDKTQRRLSRSVITDGNDDRFGKLSDVRDRDLDEDSDSQQHQAVKSGNSNPIQPQEQTLEWKIEINHCFTKERDQYEADKKIPKLPTISTILSSETG